MAFLLGNEVDQWYVCLEVCLGNSGLKKMEFTAIKDEVAEFLTKTERRKSKNTQTYCSMGVIYCLTSIFTEKNICFVS